MMAAVVAQPVPVSPGKAVIPFAKLPDTAVKGSTNLYTGFKIVL